jgi:hypothetical protein
MNMAAVGAAAAIAAAAEFMRQEEEEMTPYSEKDLAEGWEFKILRSALAAFRKPEHFRAVLEEERKGGWVLVEKFDDYRIRLKRPAGTKMREAEFEDGYDPYRTFVGITVDRRAFISVVFGGGVILLFILSVILFSNG